MRELYAAVVASEHPEKVRELLAYQAMKPAGVVAALRCCIQAVIRDGGLCKNQPVTIYSTT